MAEITFSSVISLASIPSWIKSHHSQPHPSPKNFQELIIQYKLPNTIYTNNNPPFMSKEFKHEE